jgi:hypothetical protein
MRQTVEVKVTLTFEAENEINKEGKTELENNIIEGLEYIRDTGNGLCPEQMDGFTIDIWTDME